MHLTNCAKGITSCSTCLPIKAYKKQKKKAQAMKTCSCLSKQTKALLSRPVHLSGQKKYKVKDEALSWEEFGQANYRMLGAMHQQEWPDDHLKMVHDFWVALETHFWHHDSSKYCRHALLVYQGRVRKDWDKRLGMADTFHLLPLNTGHLNDYHQELLNNVYVSKIEAIQVSTSSPPACIPMLTFSHLSSILPLLLICVFRISSPPRYPIPMLYMGFFPPHPYGSPLGHGHMQQKKKNIPQHARMALTPTLVTHLTSLSDTHPSPLLRHVASCAFQSNAPPVTYPAFVPNSSS